MQSYANVLQSMQNTHAVINRNQQYDRYNATRVQLLFKTGSVCRVIVEIRIYTGHSKDVLDRRGRKQKLWMDGTRGRVIFVFINKEKSHYCSYIKISKAASKFNKIRIH